MLFPSVQEQLDLIAKNTVEIISEEELTAKLKKSIESKTPLKVKLGADPSRPDLHIGHGVVLQKLRDFQDLGHTAILIIGDFTAQIGDPSGKSKTRPQITPEETQQNSQSYFEQASKILDPQKTQIVYNSHWLGSMSFADVIRLSSHYTVARMLERDDFEKRYQNNEPISIHEFLYPLAQAMDSVELKNDVEIGGTDQKFNLLVGRDLQREYGLQPQICITLPILEGLYGKEKMSKSLGNAISFNDSPDDMFGKVLSIPDNLIENYFRLAAQYSTAEVESIKSTIETKPRDAKRKLAFEIVKKYHTQEAAKAAQEQFDRVFIRKEEPDDLPITEIGAGDIAVADLLVELGASRSKSESRRLITQGGITIDQEKVTDFRAIVALGSQPMLIKVGKRRFYKVTKK